MIAPPVLSDAINCDYSLLEPYYSIIQQETGIPCISDPLDYIFDAYYMFDTIYHCNNMGEMKRTKLLVEDLKKVLD